MSDQPVINFVHGDIDAWADVAAESGRDIPLADLAPRILMGREIWVVQAFQLLRQRGLPVKLSGELEADAINVVHCDDIFLSADLWRYFIVSVRADRDPAFVSQVEIVQNEHSIWNRHDIFIPHWPQPGLLPRRSERGNKIENVIYMGKEENLDPSLRGPEFRARLKEVGMNLLIRDKDWWDYRDADIVLAVRSGTPFYLGIKPASKLVNAWLAGCPAILSPEPGYRELRRSQWDFVEASSVDDVVNALVSLKESPALFTNMVLNGQQQAQSFTTDVIAARWETVLSGPVKATFHEWKTGKSRTFLRRVTFYFACMRRRLWGCRAVQTQQPVWRERLGQWRRRILIPASGTHLQE